MQTTTPTRRPKRTSRPVKKGDIHSSPNPKHGAQD